MAGPVWGSGLCFCNRLFHVNREGGQSENRLTQTLIDFDKPPRLDRDLNRDPNI